jgi:hypothetical protein
MLYRQQITAALLVSMATASAIAASNKTQNPSVTVQPEGAQAARTDRRPLERELRAAMLARADQPFRNVISLSGPAHRLRQLVEVRLRMAPALPANNENCAAGFR